MSQRKIYRLRPLMWSAAFTALSLATPCSAQPAQATQIELPAGDLAESIRALSRQTGANIIVPSELIRGRRAPAISGRLEPEDALRRLLAGSGLAVQQSDGALIVAAGSSPAPEQFAEEAVIVVTGTNLRGGTPTSPPLAITRRDIDQTGATSVEQLMRQVPQNFGGGVQQENFAVVGGGADITEHGAGLNLRGLGQRATLVLLNGRRLAPSGAGAFADVSLIPLSAVERVEILPDGASAIYGSDAVGGVVNFLLRRRFHGVEASLSSGTATRGDGDQLLAGLTAGQRWSSGSALLAYEYRRADEIAARDRDYVVNLPPRWSLFPSERRHSLFGSVEQDLSGALRMEATGFFAQRDTQRSYFQSVTPIPVEADAEAESAGGTAALIYGFSPGWTAELSGSYALSETDQRQVQTGGQGLVNRLASRHDIRDLRLKVDGALFDLPAGPARIALGGEQRRETYWSLFETSGTRPNVKTAERHVAALFGEINLPLFSAANRQPGLERLIVTAAGRFEHYDELGSTFNPKLGLRWDPASWLTLRGSYDTSFRAPLLSESTGYYNAFLFPAALLYRNPASAPRGVGVALVGSDPEIEPERSRSWTAGAAVRPLEGLELTATYYAIRFTNRIALPTPQINVVGDPARASVVTLNPSVETASSILSGAGQVLDFSGPGFTNGGATPADVRVIVDARVTNTAETVTDGLDLGLRYAFAVGRNRLSANLDATLIFGFEDRLTADTPVTQVLNTPYRPNGLRLRGAFSWARDALSASAILSHVGSYEDNRTAAMRDVDAFTTLDLSAAYELAGGGILPHLRLAVALENVFDADPPRLVPDPGSTRGLGFDPVNASARGRAVTLQLRARW